MTSETDITLPEVDSIQRFIEKDEALDCRERAREARRLDDEWLGEEYAAD